MSRPSWTQYIPDERTKQRRTDKTEDLLEQNTRRLEQEAWREMKEKEELLNKVKELCPGPFAPNLWHKQNMIRLYFMDGSFLTLNKQMVLSYNTEKSALDLRAVSRNTGQMFGFLKKHFPDNFKKDKARWRTKS